MAYPTREIMTSAARIQSLHSVAYASDPSKCWSSQVSIKHPNRRHTWPLGAFVVAALAMVLAGCGAGATRTGLIKRINPPSAAFERLNLADEGSTRVALRLHNFSTIPMTYGQITATIRIDGRTAGQLLVNAGIEIPGLSSDVIDIELPLDARARARIARADREAGAFSYGLEGTIQTTAPAQRFPFLFDSRLNPVPGRPGEFR